MAAWEGKKYKLELAQNFDEYLKALGVDADKIKLASSGTDTFTLVKNGDEYEYISTSTGKAMKFKPGVEFDMDTYDGQKIKTLYKFETPNKLVMEQKGDKSAETVREFSDTEMIATYSFKGVTAVRYYKAI
ncbi:unnamed protein product [Hermetia illucens]|uniref:Cytosolic fatty-acid binding proteins domain-containing protein n=1 Tax=Hermetia illucens TaxID=343691 RepID=A0A7R8V5L8_HERIL|nr:probable fatty acid-binding protein [Hermetia illucens]CAD7093316.1 unnamed protein product [Hermetia illucens]